METGPLTFFALYIWKIVEGPRFYHESIVRTMERLALMFIAPGLSNHWPSDYKRCLRKHALLRYARLGGVQTG